jgi:hypothetical protein
MDRRPGHEHSHSLSPISEEGPYHGGTKASEALAYGPSAATTLSRPLASLPSVRHTYGLLEHVMVSDGTVRIRIELCMDMHGAMGSVHAWLCSETDVQPKPQARLYLRTVVPSRMCTSRNLCCSCLCMC